MVASCLLLVSCKSTQVVSSTDNTIKKDSTITSNKSVQKDSSIYRESVTEKVIPESHVDFILGTGARLDSIEAFIKAMPKGVPQVITIPDKTHNAIIQLFIDSLGRMAVRCTSSEKKSFDKVTQLEHYNSSLTNQLTQKNIELNEVKTQNLQLKKGFWARFDELIENIAVRIFIGLIILLVIVIMIEIFIKKCKALAAWFASTVIKKTL